jgi:hypothetical protein
MSVATKNPFALLEGLPRLFQSFLSLTSHQIRQKTRRGRLALSLPLLPRLPPYQPVAAHKSPEAALLPVEESTMRAAQANPEHGQTSLAT